MSLRLIVYGVLALLVGFMQVPAFGEQDPGQRNPFFRPEPFLFIDVADDMPVLERLREPMRASRGEPSDVLQFEAWLIMPEMSAALDVTELCTWELVSGHEIATLVGPGQVRVTDFGRGLVRASNGTLEATLPFRYAERQYTDWQHLFEERAQERGDSPPPAPGDEQVRNAVREGLREASRYGIPGQEMRIMLDANQIRLWVDRARSYLAPGSPAAFGPGGPHSGPLGVTQLRWFLQRTVVLDPAAATSLVNNGLVNDQGILNPAAAAMLQEFVHALIDIFGLDWPLAFEELFTAEYELVLAPMQVNLYTQLSQFRTNPPTASQARGIRNTVRRIRESIQRIRDNAPADKRVEVEMILDQLNLADRDSNGIPDAIDEIVDRLFPDGPPDWLIPLITEPTSPADPTSKPAPEEPLPGRSVPTPK